MIELNEKQIEQLYDVVGCCSWMTGTEQYIMDEIGVEEPGDFEELCHRHGVGFVCEGCGWWYDFDDGCEYEGMRICSQCEQDFAEEDCS